jgi:uncharacterized protein
MVRPSAFVFSCVDLPRRAGEMREYSLSITDHEPVGIPLVAIPTTGPIDLDLRLESVAQGVLVTATVSGEAIGECTRCLEEVVFFVEEDFQELYHYEIDHRLKKKRGEAKEIIVEDEDEILEMQGDDIDLEGPIRDAVILNLPINPLCSESCEGLCPDCGVKWDLLPDEHDHPKEDIRWAGLEGWKDPKA